MRYIPLGRQRTAAQNGPVRLVPESDIKGLQRPLSECRVDHRGVSLMCCYTGAPTRASTEAACPDCKACGTALGCRCCGYRRAHPLGHRTTRQNDDRRTPDLSAERHFGNARGLRAFSELGGMRHAANRRSGAPPSTAGGSSWQGDLRCTGHPRSRDSRIRPSSEDTNRKRLPCSTPNRLGLCCLLQANRLVANRCTSQRADQASPRAPTRRASRCDAPLTVRATEF